MSSAWRAFARRDLLKFWRNPLLVLAALVLPALELVVIGNTIGGKIRDVPIAFVDQDRGPIALKLRSRLYAIEQTTRAVRVEDHNDLEGALGQVRSGHTTAVIVVPRGFSAEFVRGAEPELGVVVDNTNLFLAAHLDQALNEWFRESFRENGAADGGVLAKVELFPFVNYLQYVTPGVIAAAIFVACWFGGGILYVDDRIRGFHESYLATPISGNAIVGALIASGALKATLCGMVASAFGLWYADLAGRFTGEMVVPLIAVVTTSVLALSAMITALVIRIRDPFASRVISAALNLFFWFPSGAIWPTHGFPPWMQWFSRIDPFTYLVQALRTVVLRHGDLVDVRQDLAVLAALAAASFLIACVAFPRRL